MPTHIWGDKDFNWEDLDRAMILIYHRMQKTDGSVMMKEKYGTIRYESTWGIETPRDRIVLFDAVREACNKYPHIRAEILDDFNWAFEDIPEDLKYEEDTNMD